MSRSNLVRSTFFKNLCLSGASRLIITLKLGLVVYSSFAAIKSAAQLSMTPLGAAFLGSRDIANK